MSEEVKLFTGKEKEGERDKEGRGKEEKQFQRIERIG